MNSWAVNNEMTIHTAETLRQQFKAILTSDDDLEISLEQVGEIDTAGLQLLILYKHEASQGNKSLRFVKHSSAVLDVLEITNLNRVFGDPLLLVCNDGDVL